MVTCKADSQAVAIPKMNSVRSRKPTTGSNSSGLRLLDAEHLESASSVSRNSIYKLKIDLMYDDSRSVRIKHQLDDPDGSRRTRSIIMYNRSELASTAGESTRSIRSLLHDPNEGAAKLMAMNTQKNVNRLSNSVQEQIEQLFTDVAKDATSSFAVVYLGSLPLKDKVTSLQGLQEPLRELYLSDITNEHQYSGHLDICASGLRVKINESSGLNPGNIKSHCNDEHITPFHNIAVWSAVKFVVSDQDGGAAFLPLITDPDNIDKSTLFQPLSPSEKCAVAKSSHAPIFAVVMRSSSVPKVLECHGFLCRSTEDAIVIAATLYQSLMTHVNSGTHRSTKHRAPRNQNGVSCISIASSSAMTGSHYLSRSQLISSGRKSSFRSTTGSVTGGVGGAPSSARSGRKKRVSNSSLSSSSNVINEIVETTTEERKRKSHKTKRAPPVPTTKPGSGRNAYKGLVLSASNGNECCVAVGSNNGGSHKNSASSTRNRQSALRKLSEGNFHGADLYGASTGPALPSAVAGSSVRVVGGVAGGQPQNGTVKGALRGIETNGDILTRVAIPRSGSFLNTSGLTRYKSRAARRHSGKLCGGGGGGSPLGFSELFNEFRLQENLHSLDDILYAIINADGMSYNDLKPIYKEFLMKLAVSLTGDELFQHSKNIMRRQKKKKLKKKSSTTSSTQKKPRTYMFGTKSLKKVFQFGQFRSCRGKPLKQSRNKRDIVTSPSTMKGSPEPRSTDSYRPRQTRSGPQINHGGHRQQRSRIGTSGSDVSVVRHDNQMHGLNRNSSSGYVSCSECSYDSEACTCVSADRCYCSLKNDHKSRKLLRKNERHGDAGPPTKGHPPIGNGNDNNKHNNNCNNALINRHSLISCKSEDKCYCSLADDELPPRNHADDDSAHAQSDTTTWCDTDSCVSASKCYCQRTRQSSRGSNRTPAPPAATHSGSSSQRRQRQRSATRKPTNKLALDYELFNINGSSKSVQPHEALSVKKSVEAAAIFADMKLSQTTDIKSICSSVRTASHKAANGSCRSHAPSKNAQSSFSSKKRDGCSVDRNYERQGGIVGYSSSSSQRSCSADDLLNKLNAMEQISGGGGGCTVASIRSGCSRKAAISTTTMTTKERGPGNYQSMRAVNASLEDTLGYLP